MEKHSAFQVIDLKELTEHGVTGNKQLGLLGQTLTFTCGLPRHTFPVILTNGQFIDIKYESGPITVRIGCGNQFNELTEVIDLRNGQAVQVTCLE
ncbi:hypothetical protein [Priestia abyssalis]|uniref:hypothetical protein n=1 Tax=Priestia abyssalis TaxID=1221450 RepID=UPI0009957BFE|nr:hypothetical protein [Priestia abyssalis]